MILWRSRKNRSLPLCLNLFKLTHSETDQSLTPMSAGLEDDLSGDEVFTSRFPIHRACRDGDVGALVPLLQQPLSQSYLTVEDSCYGWTPLHWAAHHGQLECVVRLVQMGCEVNTTTSRFSQTPTHTAAFGGHPNCVVWLTQAGADVNRQDFVGEAPIHKAARSGSLECVQVLLIAGAKAHLVNASGQTAADLAYTHGFHDCFHLISKAQKHLLQHSNGATSTQELLSRKRLLTMADTSLMKKARRADNLSSGGEELESMKTESIQVVSQDDVKAGMDGLHHALPYPSQDMPPAPKPLPPPPTSSSSQRPFSDMCGSLHLVGSPSSCMSHRPAWRGAGDCGDFLHYGHYHGFGDTAEELSDSQGVEHRCSQGASSIHLYHGS